MWLDKTLKAFFALYLTSIPLSIAGMETFSSLCLLGLLITSITNKEFRSGLPRFSTNVDLFLLGFWAFVAFGVFFIDTVNPSHRIDVIGSLRWILIFYGMRVFAIRYFDFLEKYSRFFCGLILIVSFYGVLQFLTGLELIRDSGVEYAENFWRTRGFFSSVMSYSYVFGMIFFFFFAKFLLVREKFSKTNLPLLATVTFLAWSLIGTYTRGLWVALVVGILAISMYLNRRVVLGILGVILATAAVSYMSSKNIQTRTSSFLNTDHTSNRDRIYLWRANWGIFKENPLVGVGFRQNATHVRDQFEKLGISSKFVSHAHNNFMSVLGGTGAVGFFLYLSFITIFYFTGHLLYRNLDPSDTFSRVLVLGSMGAQLSFHIGGLTESNFYDGETMHAYGMSVALLYAVKYRYDNKTT